MPQLICHLLGDYIFQSSWMAQNKTKAHWPAFVHALVYSLCFVPLCWGKPAHGFHAWGSMWTIFFSHFLIDRYRLARYVVWAKNWMGPSRPWYRVPYGSGVRYTDQDEGIVNRFCTQPTPPFWVCSGTGYPPTVPPWMATWLLIVADNTLHLIINFLALKYL
jgi:hypothetical protein